jgi:hypothetical protein
MFSGGGKWEARPGTMAGVYEVRVDGSDRRHYRLFCLLEHDGAATGLGGPSVVLLAGMDKPFRSTFSERELSFAKTPSRDWTMGKRRASHEANAPGTRSVGRPARGAQNPH